MTCEAFQAISLTCDPSDVTRAERAAWVGHRRVCEECRTWWMQRGRYLAPPMKETVEQVDQRCARDRQDPEFREVAFGEPLPTY